MFVCVCGSWWCTRRVWTSRGSYQDSKLWASIWTSTSALCIQKSPSTSPASGSSSTATLSCRHTGRWCPERGETGPCCSFEVETNMNLITGRREDCRVRTSQVRWSGCPRWTGCSIKLLRCWGASGNWRKGTCTSQISRRMTSPATSSCSTTSAWLRWSCPTSWRGRKRSCTSCLCG